MKLRDTVILVILAHVGLVLIWICMGGCANDKAPEEEKVAMLPTGAEETDLGPIEMPPAGTDAITEEPAMPIQLPAEAPSELVDLPDADTLTPPPAPVREANAKETKYVVKKGDTLWAIGRNFGVSVSAIVDRNDIQNPAMIREGRELIIPAGNKPLEASAPETESSNFAAEGSPVALPVGSSAVPVAMDGETVLHTVAAGDTIWVLARKYSTTSDKIMAANNISDATKLQIGQELRIPTAE